jgi:hypothetical protein
MRTTATSLAPTRARRRLAASAVTALLAGALLTGCSSGSDEPQPSGGEKIAASLGALFDQYLARDDLSDLEREVLERAKANGEIAAQDYENAHAQEAACMTDAGYDIDYKKLANGLYKSTPHLPQAADNAANSAQVDKYFAASEHCAEGVSIVIESLYTLQQGNPDLLVDQDEAAVQCLRKAGLVPADYAAETFAAELPKSFADSPFDPNSDAAQACFAGAGIAFASAQD